MSRVQKKNEMSRVSFYDIIPINVPPAVDFNNVSGIRPYFDDSLYFSFCDIYKNTYERCGL